jgi:tripartite-type tricarboxylate transporter receptor subunit TctC
MSALRHLAILVACLAYLPAALAEYPERLVKVVVPFGPGGSTDAVARTVVQRLEKAWGKPIIVENRPGGNSTVGTAAVAGSPPDGYTVLMGVFAHAVIGSLQKDLPYDLERDFLPVIEIGKSPQILLVNPAVRATNVRELIDLIRAAPGKVAFGSAGNGSASHMGSELFTAMTGTTALNVPYKSSGQALNDLMGGQVAFMFDSAFTSLPLVRAGKLRALGVSTAGRSTIAPDLPSIAETGVPGYESSIWFGFFVPSGTPAAVVSKLNGDIDRILRDQAVRDVLRQQGLDVAGGSPDQFAGVVSQEIAKWRKVIETNRIKAD